MKIEIPWYIKVLLYFKRPTYSYDTETGGLGHKFKGETYCVVSKHLFGVTYILDSYKIYMGTMTGRFSGKGMNPQSIPRQGH